ncbi:hypothetical protein AB4Y42_43595, partial [Paraburkholderia sp. EG286B]|uniref:hypothetical protein n=1 Tax=Paraburkholderia sp. EG286B TaxID=3237011 RepID=UPI0034D2F896
WSSTAGLIEDSTLLIIEEGPLPALSRRLNVRLKARSNGRWWPITALCNQHGLLKAREAAIGSTRPTVDIQRFILNACFAADS